MLAKMMAMPALMAALGNAGSDGRPAGLAPLGAPEKSWALAFAVPNTDDDFD